MRVRIKMEGLQEGYVDYLINEDLPLLKKTLENEINLALGAFRKDRNLRTSLLRKLSSALKKAFFEKHIFEALSAFEKEIRGSELVSWIVYSKTKDSVDFEIIIDNKVFLISEAFGENKTWRIFFGKLLFTRKKWLKNVEEIVKKHYKPEKYKIEVIEE